MKSNALFRIIRIVLALAAFLLVNLLFLGIAWGAAQQIAWVAKIQFLPAVLALNFAVVALWIALTFLFGRIYCSVACPLGVMQDVFGFLGKKARRNRYAHSPEKRWLRYSVLVVFVVGLLLGFAPLTTLLAPYSSYGRIVNSLFRPLYDLLGNGLAMLESHYDSYLFSEVQIWMRSVTAFVVSLLTFFVLGVLAWRNGRTYCNTVCPVGTVLSFFSRFALLRFQLDKAKCRNCSLCEKNCKASAIDCKAGTVDHSRCVACGDCLAQCRHGAMQFRLSLPFGRSKTGAPDHQPLRTDADGNGPDTGRRAFVGALALAAGSALMAQTRGKVDGGLAVIEEKKVPQRKSPLTPPGSVSAYNMDRHCTACQLCVSACPNNVLRPSTDPMHLMQPVMSFERGYCRPECTRCSQVCPTGAIRPLTREQKTSVHVGHAVWIAQNCVPVVNGDGCGNCARHCPAGAISMVEREFNGRYVKVPVVNPGRCIGCGACEYLCPARPFSAICVEGNRMHHVD
ncbi:MAG: 4Fe-4S binding protein [Paludibacteraceae bacterium]|nr:4Fe-4S binding protein [Paludibacteraceae bacterium]